MYACSQHVMHICLKKNAKIAKVQNNVTIENLFQSYVLSINEETASQCTLKTHSKLAIIAGERAVGKTTLVNLIVQNIVNKSLFNVEYVLYIQMKWIKHERMSFVNFILPFFTDMKLDIIQQKFTIKMLEKCNNLIVVIDGFDEISNISSNVIINDDTDAFPEDFVVSMIAGNLLPNAKKLIILRPDQFQQLSQYLKCSYFTVLSLQGINEESKRNINKLISKKPNNEKIFDHISENDTTSVMCFNPLNCIFIMQCLNIFMELSLEMKQFDSFTDIYVTILELLMKSCQNMSNFNLESLLQLAWNEITSHNDRSDGKISDAMKRAFDCYSRSRSSLTILEKLQNRIRFKHEILEDFFTAIQLSFFTTAEELDIKMSLLPANRMKLIGKFIFGFENPEILHRMNQLLGGISAKKPFWEISSACKSFLSESKLKSYINEYPLFKLLQLCNLMYESKKRACDLYILKDFKIPRHGCPFASFAEVIPLVDYIGLQYVLRSLVRGKKMIVINKPQFVGDGFFQFFNNIFSFPSNIIVVAEEIIINQHVHLTQEEVKCFSCCVKRFSVIERLEVSMNSFDEEKLALLLESINQREIKLEQLCFCEVASGKTVELLGMCLNNVKELEILMIKEQPDINFEFQTFCNQVKNLENSLKKLKF